MDCAHINHCGVAGGVGAVANDCYCGAFSGAFDLNACIANGPRQVGGQNPPCTAAWIAATEQTTPANVLGAISDISVPSGWAYFLLECEATSCASVCP